jgi:hypothetical protein
MKPPTVSEFKISLRRYAGPHFRILMDIRIYSRGKWGPHTKIVKEVIGGHLRNDYLGIGLGEGGYLIKDRNVSFKRVG